jgi:hypothetical protein
MKFTAHKLNISKWCNYYQVYCCIILTPSPLHAKKIQELSWINAMTAGFATTFTGCPDPAGAVQVGDVPVEARRDPGACSCQLLLRSVQATCGRCRRSLKLVGGGPAQPSQSGGELELTGSMPPRSGSRRASETTDGRIWMVKRGETGFGGGGRAGTGGVLAGELGGAANGGGDLGAISCGDERKGAGSRGTG